MKLKRMLGGIMCFTTLLMNDLKAQQTHTYMLKEVGLTMTLPADFNVLSAEDDAAINDKGKKYIEKTVEQEIDVSATRTLLSAKKNNFNYLNCTITPYDEKKDGKWATTGLSVKKIIYDTFKAQMKDVKIDSASSMVKIDGLTFDRFAIRIKIGEIDIVSYLYSRLYKGYDLGITYLYTDPETGKQLQNMIDHSKFTR